jgi:hypothetical protein
LSIDTRHPSDALVIDMRHPGDALSSHARKLATLFATLYPASIHATPATLCHGYDTRSLSFVLFPLFCFPMGHEDVALCFSWGDLVTVTA